MGGGTINLNRIVDTVNSELQLYPLSALGGVEYTNSLSLKKKRKEKEEKDERKKREENYYRMQFYSVPPINLV